MRPILLASVLFVAACGATTPSDLPSLDVGTGGSGDGTTTSLVPYTPDPSIDWLSPPPEKPAA